MNSVHILYTLNFVLMQHIRVVMLAGVLCLHLLGFVVKTSARKSEIQIDAPLVKSARLCAYTSSSSF